MTPFAIPQGWQWSASPHHNARTKPVTAVVLHSDASASVTGTLSWLANPDSKVSYHVVVGRDGAVYAVVDPDRRAWHAGVSQLGALKDVNGYSVGVCLSNRNDGKELYPPAQERAAVDVVAALCRHYSIPVERIVTHAAIALPPGRKTDPKGFDLARFRVDVAAALGHT